MADDFLNQLKRIVGRCHVISRASEMRQFVRGYRYGDGQALAVVRPGTLVELWRVTKLCVASGHIVIAQAANTGLTGGSTPFDHPYPGDVVLVNTMRIKGIRVLNQGDQVLCLPGSTLNELEGELRPLKREPHSVIGSSCLGASVIGGIANNSGGSLIRRGPAYTEQALYARADASRNLFLVNHLGLRLDEDPEKALQKVESGTYLEPDPGNDRAHASDKEYEEHVRDLSSDQPARHNADTRRMFEASGSAGKVMIFAVRLDTFPATGATTTFYVGTNNADDLTKLRRDLLPRMSSLPISAEYLDRTTFDIADKYGRDTYQLIKLIGTNRLPTLFALKSRVDAIGENLHPKLGNLSDRLLQALAWILPEHLPRKLRSYRDLFEHHLMIKIESTKSEEIRGYLQANFTSNQYNFFECNTKEAEAAFLHRFVAAGAAVRYRAVNSEAGDLVSLDVALPRNATSWREKLPKDLDKKIALKLCYGHFFCHVFHQDYVLEADENWEDVKAELLNVQSQRNARYPAEHNFGHLYAAPKEVSAHYKDLDPCNCMNPGIGKLTVASRWADQRQNEL